MYQHPQQFNHDLRSCEVSSFEVQPQHLNTGTATNQTTRDHVNGVVAPPSHVGFGWSVGDQSGSGLAQNPPSNNGKWDAGHKLGKQNGGFGNVNDDVFPQNAQINRGNYFNGQPTKAEWRDHEDTFHDQVQDQNTQGQWTVKTYPQAPQTDYSKVPFDANWNGMDWSDDVDDQDYIPQ